jgi:chemotaxis protein CheX
VTEVQNEAMTQLDLAVAEVFETMLERSCDPMEGEVDAVEARLVARIQFTGTVDGECLLYASQATASVTAEALLGTPAEPHDPMIDDAIGELCNMIAGGWKNKLSSEQSSCLISVPAVTRGGLEGYKTQFGTKFNRNYSFQGNVFGVILAF